METRSVTVYENKKGAAAKLLLSFSRSGAAQAAPLFCLSGQVRSDRAARLPFVAFIDYFAKREYTEFNSFNLPTQANLTRTIGGAEYGKNNCDALVLSVGLIPENEVAKCAGVQLDPRSNGTVTDAFLQTSVPGIFSCGNSHAVMDLVDFVSAQGEVAGQNAAAFCRGEEMKPWVLSRLSEPAKGLPDPDALNCILCPNGCRLRYEADGSISGAKCPRGEEYARQERTSPMRTLTLTLRTEKGRLIPVRTATPIPRACLMDAVQRLQGITLTERGFFCGEVLVEDFMGTSVIATADMPAESF